MFTAQNFNNKKMNRICARPVQKKFIMSSRRCATLDLISFHFIRFGFSIDRIPSNKHVWHIYFSGVEIAYTINSGSSIFFLFVFSPLFYRVCVPLINMNRSKFIRKKLYGYYVTCQLNAYQTCVKNNVMDFSVLFFIRETFVCPFLPLREWTGSCRNQNEVHTRCIHTQLPQTTLYVPCMRLVNTWAMHTWI